MIGIAVFALVAARRPAARPSRHESVIDTIQSAVSNPVEFAKARVTGGIGAVVTADPATGLPLVREVLVGSPAEKAGLREGDIIIQVDGVANSGRTLKQSVDAVTGFAASSVTLTVQRNGSTNLHCVIHRSSWKRLGLSQ